MTIPLHQFDADKQMSPADRKNMMVLRLLARLMLAMVTGVAAMVFILLD